MGPIEIEMSKRGPAGVVIWPCPRHSPLARLINLLAAPPPNASAHASGQSRSITPGIVCALNILINYPFRSSPGLKVQFQDFRYYIASHLIIIQSDIDLIIAPHLVYKNLFGNQKQVHGMIQPEGYSVSPSACSAFGEALLDTTLAELDLLAWDQIPAFPDIAPSYDVPKTNLTWNPGNQVPIFQNTTEGPIASKENPSYHQLQRKTKYVAISSFESSALYGADKNS